MAPMGKRIAFIPARRGSLGLPGKNMALLCGRPLVDYAISAALESGCIDRVVVSSNDPRVLDHARTRGVEAVERPEEFSTSESTMAQVLENFFETDRALGPDDALCLLQPTSPLRTAGDIKGAMQSYESTRAELVLSAKPMDRSLLKCFFKTASGEVGPVSSRFSPFANRQTLPELFKPNGAIYIFSIAAFRRAGGFPTGEIALYEMDELSSLDIDQQADLLEAQTILERRNSHE